MADGVNPSGPVFISYRWSDGSGHAQGPPLCQRHVMTGLRTVERLEVWRSTGCEGALEPFEGIVDELLASPPS